MDWITTFLGNALKKFFDTLSTFFVVSGVSNHVRYIIILMIETQTITIITLKSLDQQHIKVTTQIFGGKPVMILGQEMAAQANPLWGRHLLWFERTRWKFDRNGFFRNTSITSLKSGLGVGWRAKIMGLLGWDRNGMLTSGTPESYPFFQFLDFWI